jgi:hypothetical protein
LQKGSDFSVAWRPKKKIKFDQFEAYHLQQATMPILRSGKVLQGLNKLETQIPKHQNKGKASVQKMVQPLADQIPPSSLLNITSYITTK